MYDLMDHLVQPAPDAPLGRGLAHNRGRLGASRFPGDFRQGLARREKRHHCSTSQPKTRHASVYFRIRFNQIVLEYQNLLLMTLEGGISCCLGELQQKIFTLK